MEENISYEDMDYLPLYLGEERLEFGKGNSAFTVYIDRIAFDSVYPFRQGSIFILKTKTGNLKLETIEGRQVGQSDFVATLRPIEKGINLIKIVQQLEEYHGR